MRDKAAFLRVGLLLVVGAVCVVGLLLWLGRGQVSRANGEMFETYFGESVEGLGNGSPVKYLGVTVGQVTDIGLVSAAYGTREHGEFRPAEFGLVYVRFLIDPHKLGNVPDPAEAVKLGLRIRLATQGITGITYLELDFVSPRRFSPMQVPWQPAYPYIPSIPSTFTQVQTAAQALLAKLDEVHVDQLSASLQQVLDDAHHEMADGDVHTTLAATTALMSSLNDSVQRADLPGMAADLRATMASLRTLSDGPATRELLANGNKAAANLAIAAARLPPLISTLEQTVRGVNRDVGNLQADLAPALRDARAAAANLRDTTEQLRRYPAGLLFGGPPPRR